MSNESYSLADGIQVHYHSTWRAEGKQSRRLYPEEKD